MIILGIDPALVNLGWGIIKINGQKIRYLASGNIITKNTTLLYKRLYSISNELDSIITNFAPELVSMEETFVNNNAASSLKLGYVRGAIMALVGKHDIKYAEYTPNLIKKTVTGTGHADKSQILAMIQLLLTPSPKDITFDEADALAIAYTASVNNPKSY